MKVFSIQKSVFSLALIAIIGLCLAGCEKKQKEFFIEDLQGKWCKDGAHDYRRFSAENATREGYLWGWEWNEDEGTYEDYLTPYGNGWFMYTIVGNELLEIEKDENGWMEIPKVYTLVELTSTKLVYHPKDYPNDKLYFNKVE
jgi:hypothetical protein